MDNQEHTDQVMQKLSGIESQLRSLRYTFGIGIIILAVFLTLVVPTLVEDFSVQDTEEIPQVMSPETFLPEAEGGAGVTTEEAPAATTTTP